MAEWRVTDEQPYREVEGVDHERCAALHNLIVELGWTQRGFELETLDKRTWWECYGGDEALASISERLDASVVSFLKAAWHGFAMDPVTRPHLFHRYLAQLCRPEELWENVNYDEDEDDSNKRRYISLYMANWALGATHPQGLILDQEYGTAMQHMSMEDTAITMNGRQTWLPLEMILDSFIDMIEQGKVVAVDDTYDGEQERTEPWIMPSYTQQDLDETVNAFNHLVDAILAKMPSQPQNTDENLLDFVTDGRPESLPSDSFAYRFLSQARKPRFLNIAPGLHIAQHQPFAPSHDSSPNLFPLLLFSNDKPTHQESRRAPWGQEIPISPFRPYFESDITTYPTGLYLTETDPNSIHPFEDGCKLLLPFTLGSNAFARTSDDALLGEFVELAGDDPTAQLEPTSTQLYQLGYNYFIARHDVQLKFVLWRWLDMVEEGKWEVDADGVIGGIEKWKEADTEEHWSDYQLPMSW